MRKLKSNLLVFFLLLACIHTSTCQTPHQDKQFGHMASSKTAHDMGTGSSFEHGREMLHHMMYEQAAELFNEELKTNPNNAMAHWGIAMTALRPLWAPPAPKDFENGLIAMEKAKSVGTATQKERDEIEALYNYYTTAKEEGYPQGLKAWENSLEALHKKYPDDIEIASFYGLSLLATAPNDDKTYSQQRKAGALMEELHEKDPQHPGPFHYSIHAYDNPVLAEKGIRFANAYDKLAPDVPHALHMPSHIFVRVGSWDETIDWNIRSAESALRHPHGDLTSYHHAHALDYLIYAYLQQGRDDKAKEVLDELNSIEKYQANFAAAYAIAAAPARYLLERKKWKEAVASTLDTSKSFPWKNFPQMEAISWWSRGMGAAMNNEPDAARKAVERLKLLEKQTQENNESYWAFMVNTQRKTVEAWILQSEGKHAKALALMTEAADQEDSVEKHPVTPGNVLPARELLGDMLLLQNKPEEAIMAYQAALKISPKRLNSLYGAGKAADLAGKNDLAKDYYRQFDEIVSEDSQRPELKEAKAYLQKT